MLLVAAHESVAPEDLAGVPLLEALNLFPDSLDYIFPAIVLKTAPCVDGGKVFEHLIGNLTLSGLIRV